MAVVLGGLWTVVVVVCLAAFLLYKINRFITKNCSPSRRFPRKASEVVQLCSNNIRGAGQSRYSLSIVIPAYGEEERLPEMLDDTIHYLRNRITHSKHSSREFAVEIIVVDDGSRDGTSEVVWRKARQLRGLEVDESIIHLKLIQFSRNRGKGAAVSEGILAAQGDLILFADADGSTEIGDLEKLEAAIQQGGAGLACGSRASAAAVCEGSTKKSVTVKRSPFRKLLMRAFRLFIGLGGGVTRIQDTQCGFKMLSRPAASAIVPWLHLNGWIFDIELVLLADLQGIRIAEVPVNWTERHGSKLSLAIDSIDMALDLVFMRIAYAFRLWPLPPRKVAGGGGGGAVVGSFPFGNLN